MREIKAPDTEAVIDRYDAAWNANDLEAIIELHADDIVFQLHAEGFNAAVGTDAVRFQLALLFDAWKNLRFDISDRHLSGDLVTIQYRFRAELVKPFPLNGQFIEPGGAVDVDAVDVITVSDGMVRAKHTYMDTSTMRQQLEQGNGQLNMRPDTEPRAQSQNESEAFEFVQRFTRAWASTDPDAFAPILHPKAHLVHPIEPDTHGVDEARLFMEKTMALVPDLRYDVQGWATGSGHVIIWGRLHGTLAGSPIQWPLVDRITLEDGLIRKRVAYFDPLVIFKQVIRRPRAWLPFLRAQFRRQIRR